MKNRTHTNMKKLLLMVALCAIAPMIAMEQAELRHRRQQTSTRTADQTNTPIAIDAQTKYCMHCCATCLGICCGLLQTKLIFDALSWQCQNNNR
jgi:hypothetical protein